MGKIITFHLPNLITAMNKIYCILFLFLLCNICDGQNLVLNGDFEQYTTCPTGVTQIAHCTYWYNAGDISVGSTPDYFNTCSSYPLITPPYVFAGYQMPNSGNGFSHILVYYPFGTVREAMQGTLSQPLVVGQQYYVSFYANLTGGANGTRSIATDKLGALLTTYQFSPANFATSINFAHVYTDSILSDSVNWVMVKGSFIADSAYNYITITNFFDNANTDTLMLNDSISFMSSYNIDDVCVSIDSLTCYLSSGVNQLNNPSEVSVFPNPFSDKLNIAVKSNDILEVTLFDFTARKIFNRAFTNTIKINTEQLAKGIYFYEVQCKGKLVRKGKILKE